MLDFITHISSRRIFHFKRGTERVKERRGKKKIGRLNERTKLRRNECEWHSRQEREMDGQIDGVQSAPPPPESTPASHDA